MESTCATGAPVLEKKRPTSQVETDRQTSIRDDGEWQRREEDKHKLTCFTREGERGVEGKGGRRGLGKGTQPGRWSGGRQIEASGGRRIESWRAAAGGSRLESREDRGESYQAGAR